MIKILNIEADAFIHDHSNYFMIKKMKSRSIKFSIKWKGEIAF